MRRSQSTGSQRSALHPGQIMIVEDEFDGASYLSNMLERMGYRIAARVKNGKEAIDGAKKLHPDLILMDIALNGEADGIGAVKTIHDYLDIPVVFITSPGDRVLLNPAYMAESAGYLIKPVNEDGLQATIQTVLHRHSLEAGLLQRDATIGAIANVVPEAFVMADKDGKITFWNPAAEKMFGFTYDEMRGKPLLKKLLSLQHREDMDKRFEIFRRTGKGPMIEKPMELAALRKGGKEFPVEISFSPFQLNNEWHLLAVIRDITDLKNLEGERKQYTKRLENNLVQTIQAVALMMEKHDPDTATHQQRVADLAVAIGMELNLPKDVMEGLYLGGVIHDIGKIYVPLEILTQPGKLTPIEFGFLKTHAQIGYEIIKGVDFNWPVSNMVLQHHERLNGSGYPHGLEGDEILLEARILGVADVVEAMTMHRPYRSGLGIDKALEEISSKRGVSYDPMVAGACIRVFREKHFAFKE